MNRQSVQRLVETAVALALSGVLHAFKVYQMPQGGSITLGSMVPIFYIALRWGGGWGILTGVLASGIIYLTEPVFVHPLQVILDYPIAFGVLGVAGFFRTQPVFGIIVGGVGRFAAHFLSGVVYFASYAPKGVSPVAYSAAYNASYMVPELLFSIILTIIVLRIMQRARPVPQA
ncbi:MAG TPA: energy-coupled thiamine transporter ThiT [bacterium]|jgi:thiamine transporter